MLWHSTILGPTFLERTSTFIVLSSIVKSPIKRFSFSRYRCLSLRSPALLLRREAAELRAPGAAPGAVPGPRQARAGLGARSGAARSRPGPLPGGGARRDGAARGTGAAAARLWAPLSFRPRLLGAAEPHRALPARALPRSPGRAGAGMRGCRWVATTPGPPRLSPSLPGPPAASLLGGPGQPQPGLRSRSVPHGGHGRRSSAGPPGLAAAGGFEVPPAPGPGTAPGAVPCRAQAVTPQGQSPARRCVARQPAVPVAGARQQRFQPAVGDGRPGRHGLLAPGLPSGERAREAPGCFLPGAGGGPGSGGSSRRGPALFARAPRPQRGPRSAGAAVAPVGCFCGRSPCVTNKGNAGCKPAWFIKQPPCPGHGRGSAASSFASARCANGRPGAARPRPRPRQRRRSGEGESSPGAPPGAEREPRRPRAWLPALAGCRRAVERGPVRPAAPGASAAPVQLPAGPLRPGAATVLRGIGPQPSRNRLRCRAASWPRARAGFAAGALLGAGGAGGDGCGSTASPRPGALTKESGRAPAGAGSARRARPGPRYTKAAGGRQPRAGGRGPRGRRPCRSGPGFVQRWREMKAEERGLFSPCTQRAWKEPPRGSHRPPAAPGAVPGPGRCCAAAASPSPPLLGAAVEPRRCSAGGTALGAGSALGTARQNPARLGTAALCLQPGQLRRTPGSGVTRGAPAPVAVAGPSCGGGGRSRLSPCGPLPPRPLRLFDTA